jgi:hypothetical protein
MEVEKNNQKQEYADLFSNLPAVGFYTYGETCLGHLNQTLTMLVLE